MKSPICRSRLLAELGLEACGSEISAIRRCGIRSIEPMPETRLEEGDVIVVLGEPGAVMAAEQRLLQN